MAAVPWHSSARVAIATFTFCAIVAGIAATTANYTEDGRIRSDTTLLERAPRNETVVRKNRKFPLKLRIVAACANAACVDI
jgi:hypothetical protein